MQDRLIGLERLVRLLLPSSSFSHFAFDSPTLFPSSQTSKLTSLSPAAGIISNTAASNLSGHPTLTIPCGFTPPSPDDILSPEDEKIRLPAGMMLMGKLFGEEKLLAIGDAWEQEFDWKKL